VGYVQNVPAQHLRDYLAAHKLVTVTDERLTRWIALTTEGRKAGEEILSAHKRAHNGAVPRVSLA
jgi:hypothetical protein